MIPIFVSGPSNSGKTTLIERLIPILVSRGLRVAAAKHDPHGHAAVDASGKDSSRFANAGAEVVDILGPDSRVSISTSSVPGEISPEAARCDIVLVEGFKKGPRQRIEVVPAGSKPILEPGTFALVADHDVASELPTFRHQELEQLADLLLDRVAESSLPVVILSGGASQRMGRDKATIMINDGETMLERAVTNARAVASRVVVISRHSSHESIASSAGATFLQDHGRQHPASGLVAALESLGADSGVVAMPCDSPDMSPGILRHLTSVEREGMEFACFAVGGRLNPLPGYFSPATIPALRVIARDGLPLHTLASHVQTLIISEREARALDADLASFRSINTPADLGLLESAGPSVPGDHRPDGC